MYETFGDVIREYRKANDLSMADFAKLANVSKAYVGMLERGENYKTHRPIIPSLPMLSKIASGMNMRLSDLMRMVPNGLVQTSGADEQDLLEALDAGTAGFRNSCELYCEAYLDGSDEAEDIAPMIDIYRQLTKDNQAKLMEIAKLYLDSQSRTRA